MEAVFIFCFEPNINYYKPVGSGSACFIIIIIILTSTFFQE